MQDEHEDWLDEDVSPDAPSAHQIPAETPENQQIDFDLNCVRCGYNLRSAFAAGNCPECGEPVETTLRPDLLHMANSTWLGKLRKGMNWLVTGILMNLGMIPIAIVLGIASTASAMPGNNAPLPLGAMIFLGLLGITISVIYIVAVWFMTEPEHDIIQNRTSRSVTRWALIPALAMSIVSVFFSFSTQPEAVAISGCIDLISSIALAIGFFTSLWYLQLLANRIPEPSLAKQTMIVFWGNIAWIGAMFLLVIGFMIFAVSMSNSTSPNNTALGVAGAMGLLFCPLLIAMLVFGIWWIVLMFRYRTRFAQAHDIAIGRSKTIAADSA